MHLRPPPPPARLGLINEQYRAAALEQRMTASSGVRGLRTSLSPNPGDEAKQ